MPAAATSSILDTVHCVETPALKRCGNPLCQNRFPQSGLPANPRRFCSDTCKQQASIIRRAAALLDVLSDAEVLRVVRDG